MIDFAMKELIALLNEIKPQYGAVGSRDVDVTAQRKRIDDAIAMLEAMSEEREGGGFVKLKLEDIERRSEPEMKTEFTKQLEALLEFSKMSQQLLDTAFSSIKHGEHASYEEPHVEPPVSDATDVFLSGLRERMQLKQTLSTRLNSSAPASYSKPEIDMEDANHFSISRLHEIIYGKPLVWPEAKLLARFMHDVKQRFSAQEQSNA